MSKENDPSRLHCRRQIDSGMTSSDGADSMDDYVLVPHDDAAVIDAVAVPHSDEDDISNDISDEDDRLTTVSLGSWRDVGVFHENTSSYEDFADLSEFIHHSCSESDEEASDSYNSTTAQPIHVEDHGGDISTAIIVDDESHIDNNNSGVEAHYHHQDDEADSGHDQSHHESHHESNESHHESNESQRRHHDSTSNILDASDPPEETDKFKKFHGATVRRRGHDYRHLCSSDISVRRENTKQQCARFSVERSFFFVSAEDGSIEKKFFSSRLTTQTSITPVTALDLKYPSRFKFFSNGSYYHSATTTWGRRFDFEILDKMLREFSVSEPIIQRHHRSGLDDRPVTEGIYELPIVGYQVRTLNEDDLREAMFRTRGYRCRQRPKGPPSHHPLDVYRCIRPSNPRSSSSYVLLGRLDNSTSAPTKVPELGAQMKCPSKQRSKYWRHPFDTVENGWSEWATFDFGSDRILCAVSSMPCLSLKIIDAGSKRRWQCIDDSRSQWADRIMLQTRRDRGKEWIGRGNFATAGNAWSESVMALNDTADKKDGIRCRYVRVKIHLARKACKKRPRISFFGYRLDSDNASQDDTLATAAISSSLAISDNDEIAEAISSGTTRRGVNTTRTSASVPTMRIFVEERHGLGGSGLVKERGTRHHGYYSSSWGKSRFDRKKERRLNQKQCRDSENRELF